ncbi:KR domain-containing protein [Streptomyces sp. FXJ1.4098]|nr:KR domain-containing protein [Streptomyces sp. FXJ1.4098]
MGHLPAVAGGGTVLIGAGPGTPAELVAEHLVRTGQARRLLLAVPPESGGASGLVSRLTEAGAEVTVAEADLTDAAAVAALLAGIDPRHPLTGVLHAPRDAGWRGAAAARELHLATAGLPSRSSPCSPTPRPSSATPATPPWPPRRPTSPPSWHSAAPTAGRGSPSPGARGRRMPKQALRRTTPAAAAPPASASAR